MAKSSKSQIKVETSKCFSPHCDDSSEDLLIKQVVTFQGVKVGSGSGRYVKAINLLRVTLKLNSNI
jgi:hypothetical protein